MASRETQARWRRKAEHLERGDLELEEFWATPDERRLMLRLGLVDDLNDPAQIKAAYRRMIAVLAKNNSRRV